MALIYGLVSYYKMDTGSGTTAFDSVGTNDGTLINSPNWVNGKINTGVEGNSATDGLKLPNGYNLFNINNKSFTFSFWYNHNDTFHSDWNCIIGLNEGAHSSVMSSNTGIQIALEATNNKIILRKGTGEYSTLGNYIRSSNGISTNNWQHIVITMENNSLHNIYINNVNQSIETVGNGITSSPIQWGNHNNNSILTSYINNNGPRLGVAGIIDEIGIWNRALTSTEISELWNNGDGLQYGTGTFVEPEPDLTNGLISYYKMDTGSGTTLFDSVGDNDGTLSNTRIWTTSGKINGGGDFTQGSDFVNLGNFGNFGSQLGNPFNISYWIKINTTGDTASLSVADTGGNQDITLQLIRTNKDAIGQSEIFFRDDSGNRLTGRFTASIYDNNWHHLSCNFMASTNTLEMYVDGSRVTITYDRKETPSNFFNLSTYISLGCLNNRGTNQQFFNGLIDEIGIWNRALTSTEITELYNSGDGLQYPFSATPTTKKGNIFFGFGGG